MSTIEIIHQFCEVNIWTV